MTGNHTKATCAIVASTLALTACTVATGADADGGSFDSLDAFRGANGLLSNVATASFATESLVDTALGLRIDAVLGVERRPPTASHWQRLWRDDAEDALWKAHLLCSAISPSEVRAVLPEASRIEMVHQSRVHVDRAIAATAPESGVGSLSMLVGVSVAWCLGAADLLEEASLTVVTVLASIEDNAALSLQWRDMLSSRAVMAVPTNVVSEILPAEPPPTCDDRVALEAGALILLDAISEDIRAGLTRCAVDDALDSDEPQVLLTAARVLDHRTVPGESALRARIERRMADVRRGGGAYVTRSTVSGSLTGTAAGMRLLAARGDVVAPGDAAGMLAAMEAHARPESGDALLILQSCLLVQTDCGRYTSAGLAAAEMLARQADPEVTSLDGLLAALATVRRIAPARVDAITHDLAGSVRGSCARDQLARFDDAVRAGGWPDAASWSAARDDLIAALVSGRFDNYCDVSWVTRLADPDKRPAGSSAHDIAFTTEGLPTMRDEIAPLSVAAAAADLGVLG